MPSSWNVYYVIFLSALLAVGLPATLALVSRFVSEGDVKKHSEQEKNSEQVSNVNEPLLGRRINGRFFLGVNAALILITLILTIIPCVVQLQNLSNQNSIFRVMVAMITIAGFAAIGLLYSVKKGDLRWLESFQKDSKGQMK